jgi:hypothetical protein
MDENGNPIDMTGFYTDPWAGSADTSMSNIDPSLFDFSSLVGSLGGVDFSSMFGDPTGGMDYSSLFGATPDYTSLFPTTDTSSTTLGDYTGAYGPPSFLSSDTPLSAVNPAGPPEYLNSQNSLTPDGSVIINGADGKPLGYVDANGQYQSYKDAGMLTPEQANAASQAASQAGKASTGGGSGGGGSQPKQQTTPLQQGTKNALSLLNMIAPFLTKGVKSPAPIDNRGTTAMSWVRPQSKADGGRVQNGPNKTSIGALGLLKAHTKGQEDVIPVAAAGGEYVFDADTVSALGDGNTDAGAKVLDGMRQQVRKHKRSAPADKIPPKAKSPLAYLAGAK